MRHEGVTPYGDGKKKNEQVASMFDNISRRYDLLNDLLSLGIHKSWRKKCVNLLRPLAPKKLLDVATGTGDLAIACSRLDPESITGIDISEGMLLEGKKKIARLGLEKMITLRTGDAETVGFPDNQFDAITVGFGVRNFANLEKGLANLYRMLKPGGRLVVLEFSYPKNRVVKAGYNFYFSYVTPFVGKIFSRDIRAYTYLTESVKAFPHDEAFVAVLRKSGFVNPDFNRLSFGIAAIYSATK